MNKNAKILIGVLVVAVVALGGYVALNQPDDRTLGEKLEDAGNALDDGGVDDAFRELEDRTPAESIQDEAEDTFDNDQ